MGNRPARNQTAASPEYPSSPAAVAALRYRSGDSPGHERVSLEAFVELGSRNAMSDDRAALATGDRAHEQ